MGALNTLSCKICFFNRTTFSEFAQKFGKESRFKSIEKMRERESLYNEFMMQVRKQAKEEGISKAEKVGSNGAFLHGGWGGGGEVWVVFYSRGRGIAAKK